MNTFQSLLEQTSTDQQTLHAIPLIQSALKGNIDLQTYSAFLKEAYHHVKHTIPLLMATGAELDTSQEWLRVAMAEYIDEEIGHEQWILNDLEACGEDRQEMIDSRPSLATELMVAYAYDSVRRVNPIAMLGMVHVLEGTSAALATNAAVAIQNSLGLPEKAFSYLQSHGSLDLKHVAFFETLVNRIDSSEDKECLFHSARVFYLLYGNIFRHIEATSNMAEAA